MFWRINIFVFLLLVFSYLHTKAQDGEALFKGNCGSCHQVHKKMTGPALSGVHDRWGNAEEEMIAFVKNSQGYMKAGRPKSAYAQALFNEFNNTVMPAQALSDDEIKAIFAYVKAAPAPKDQAAGDKQPQGGSLPISEKSLFFGLSALVAVLLFVSLAGLLIIGAVAQAIKAKDSGEALTWAGVQESFSQLAKNKFVLTVLAFIVLAGVGNSAINLATSINFHDGYKPVQPVAFSHKLHAGQYKINCQYCHVGVERGKSATIPSANICMNCHNHIEEGPKYGKKEIAKVREAYEKNKPIEWVKVHNLPDLVYFNHAQHVKVAGLECQECHGPIEEMEEVYQYSRLTMGWCVNCHRQKEVDINKNDYYKSIHAKLREDMASGKAGKITVEKLGGLECARCHY